jgi:hypothetical protein
MMTRIGFSSGWVPVRAHAARRISNQIPKQHEAEPHDGPRGHALGLRVGECRGMERDTVVSDIAFARARSDAHKQALGR